MAGLQAYFEGRQFQVGCIGEGGVVRDPVAHVAEHSHDHNDNCGQIANFLPLLLLELLPEESEFLRQAHEIAEVAVLGVFVLRVGAGAVSYQRAGEVACQSGDHIISTMQGERVTTFLVEHMEPYLFQWCLSEYLAMQQYLRPSSAKLAITNSQAFLDYSGPHQEENQRNVDLLKASFAEDPEKYRLIPGSLEQSTASLQGKICMLDMRGEKELSTTDSWDYIVFGGVLGDHPPRDRPAPLRKHFVEIRHLGSMQLATDTAVLVSKLILCNGLPLNSIPMIQAPTLRGLNKRGEKTTVQMEGFSYVSQELDLEKGELREGLSKKEKKQVHMSEGVRRLLLEEDLEQDLLM